MTAPFDIVSNIECIIFLSKLLAIEASLEPFQMWVPARYNATSLLCEL